MLKEKVTDLLLAHFEGNFHLVAVSDRFAIFTAKHTSVGNVDIVEDGPEIIVEIGNITHRHFGSYDECLSESEAQTAIAEAVVEFLADLFADKYVLYRSAGECGSAYIDYFHSEMERSDEFEYFVWSGPYET